MSAVSLEQFKSNLSFEANDIEKKLERGQNTPQNIQRLEQINEMLEIIARNEKENSILKVKKAKAKQLKMEVSK